MKTFDFTRGNTAGSLGGWIVDFHSKNSVFIEKLRFSYRNPRFSFVKTFDFRRGNTRGSLVGSLGGWINDRGVAGGRGIPLETLEFLQKSTEFLQENNKFP